MRDLVDQMLAMIDRSAWAIDGVGNDVTVTVAGVTIAFGATAGTNALAFERLGSVVESVIATERAQRMVKATGLTAEPPPLWLVSGSDILAAWLRWAGAGNALRRALVFTGVLGLAPVTGTLDRRARRDLGQGGAKIRVRSGMAVAERIELSEQPRCVAMLGQHARFRIEGHKLPETLICALQRDARGNAPRPLADVVSHPFVASADLKIRAVTNEGPAVVFEVESHDAPLDTVPPAARAVLPADADPRCPWRATASERRRLDGLVEEARHRIAATDGQR